MIDQRRRGNTRQPFCILHSPVPRPPYLFAVNHQIIDTSSKLAAWCKTHHGTAWLALDTEFISENHYQPLLCLVQVASPQGLFLLDPMKAGDLQPFWELLVEGPHKTIVHACQSELGFCYRYTGRFPRKLFDVQVAAGMAGFEYPVGYTNLVSRLLGQTIPGTESRTNWKARPLTSRQIEYALDDILYLRELETALKRQLRGLGRKDWFREEMVYQMAGHFHNCSSPQWRKLVRNATLDSTALAVVRGLWHWREAVARRQNRTPRRVLRDDLIMEFARRKLADVNALRNIRGMEQPEMRRLLPEIAHCVNEALSLPPEACPKRNAPRNLSSLAVTGQLLYSALNSVCHREKLAIGLVGSPTDVKEWIAWRLQMCHFDIAPLMARGWRAEIVGPLFDDLLSGRRAIRITSPTSEFPIDFVEYGQ